MEPRAKLNFHGWISLKTYYALYDAMRRTGKEKQQIIREALEDYLITYGFMGEEDTLKESEGSCTISDGSEILL